jgi:hypothetical protein
MKQLFNHFLNKVNKNRTFLIPLLGVGGLFLLQLLSSCSENIADIVPGNGNVAYVNFYNAMEAAHQSLPSDSLGFYNMIYVNDSVSNTKFRSFPQFSESTLDDKRQYPFHFTGTPYITDIAGGYGDVFWMPITADTYKFIYTSRFKVFLKDTTVVLKPNTYTTQYIAESPATDSTYTVVTVPVEPKAVQGKVRVQIVNLATDWGAIDVYQVDEDGKKLTSTLPVNLSFGGYSPYAELDIANADKNNKLVLKFRKNGETAASLTTTVSAISGSTYTLVVQGFINETMRRIKKSNTGYISVDVMPDLRVNNRKMY